MFVSNGNTVAAFFGRVETTVKHLPQSSLCLSRHWKPVLSEYDRNVASSSHFYYVVSVDKAQQQQQ